MRDTAKTVRLLGIGITTAAALFAAYLVVDTLRTIVPLWSPLPWFDEWATVALIDRWQKGTMSAAQVLFAQHSEHRILVPRLAFFADDLLFKGGGYLCLVAIFVVQALHAGLFAAVLARAPARGIGRWAVAAVVLAMMFSLRQSENLSSAFQLQFVAVFAGATLAFVLFALAARRMRDGGAAAWPLLASFGASLLTTFTMANGLFAGYVLFGLALAARVRPRIVIACAAWAVLLTAVFLNGYDSGQPHKMPPDLLPAFLGYVCSYLGGIVTAHHANQAAAFGGLGLVATGFACWRVARQRGRPAGSLALAGVMLFVVATAAATASGRLDQGIDQALSSRYTTGSVAFWAAQLTYWWSYPPASALRIGRVRLPPGALVRAAAAAVALLLCLALAKEQNINKPDLAVKSFVQNDSANLLMLGLTDPAVVSRAAWSEADVRRLLPVLEGYRLSIFGTRDYASIGRPVTERGVLGSPCDGAIASATADPTLGAEGVRVSGRAADGGHLIRHVLLADAAGRIAGFASGMVPAAPRGTWRGFAVAPAGSMLTAYGLRDGGGLCPLGEARVASSE